MSARATYLDTDTITCMSWAEERQIASPTWTALPSVTSASSRNSCTCPPAGCGSLSSVAISGGEGEVTGCRVEGREHAVHLVFGHVEAPEPSGEGGDVRLGDRAEASVAAPAEGSSRAAPGLISMPTEAERPPRSSRRRRPSARRGTSVCARAGPLGCPRPAATRRRHDVGVDDPLQFGDSGVRVAYQSGQCDVEHGVVQRDDEQRDDSTASASQRSAEGGPSPGRTAGVLRVGVIMNGPRRESRRPGSARAG